MLNQIMRHESVANNRFAQNVVGRKLFVVGLASLLAVGTGVRLPRLFFGSVWYDEYLTITTIRLPWNQLLLGRYSKELHPPFYFALLKLWVQVLGTSEFNMRLLSLLFALGSIVLIYLLSERLVGWQTALGATAIFALHPTYIYYATEIRMYSLLIFSCLLAFFAFVQYTSEPGHKKVWLCILLLALLIAAYTQYFGVLVALGIALFSIMHSIVNKRKLQIPIFCVLGLVLLFYVPWVKYVLLPQAQSYKNTYQIAPQQLLTWKIFPAMFALTGDVTFDRLNWLNIISLIASLGGLVILVSKKEFLIAIMLTGFILLSAVVAIAISSRNVYVVARYMLHVNIFSIILASCSLIPQEKLPLRLVNILGLGVIVGYLYIGLAAAPKSSYIQPEYRDVAAFVEKEKRPSEPIVIMGWDAKSLQFYLQRETFLSSYELEQQLAGGSQQPSYIVIDSPSARKLPFLDTATVLFQLRDHQIRVMRYEPGRAASGR